MLNLILNQSLELVKRSKTAVLATIDENGHPYLKAMIKTQAIDLKEFYFCSNTSSKRVKQILNNPNASLYFYDEDTFEGLMLIGTVMVSYDQEKRDEFFCEEMKIYYPLGQNDPDYALVKFTAIKGNYYYNLHNTDFDI